MLQLKVKTTPITRFLKFIRIFFFYVNGSNFKISASVMNPSSQKFNGGNLKIVVTYAFGNLWEQIIAQIGPIEPKGEVKVNFQGQDKWGVLAQGHALFWASISDNSGNLVQLFDKQSRPLVRQEQGYHVHTVHSLTPGELYSLIALTVTSIAFVTNVILTIIINYGKLLALF
jgi:hypothetical protein